MKQAIWALIALVALGVGFLGGQMLSGTGRAPDSEALTQLQARLDALERRIGELQQDLQSLKSTPATAPATTAQGQLWRVGFVRVNQLALRFQEDNPKLKRQVEEKLGELQQRALEVQKKLQQGEIDQTEAQLQILQLQQELQKAALELIAVPLQIAINQVAQEQGYDLVLKREDVVLYSRENVLDDLTEDVWDVLQTMR
jgi:Skp family chaperone for outer membrane proteins